eukprot:SAG11_NODE_401_length_9759_cov_119.937992_2_plen_113_part_00
MRSTADSDGILAGSTARGFENPPGADSGPISQNSLMGYQAGGVQNFNANGSVLNSQRSIQTLDKISADKTSLSAGGTNSQGRSGSVFGLLASQMPLGRQELEESRAFIGKFV